MYSDRHPAIGSVSHGTMRHEDLIPCFADLLLRFTKPNPEVTEIERHMRAEGYYDSEDSDWDLEYLFDALDEIAPPFCYFGAKEGDDRDYGFWVSRDDLEYGNEVNGVLRVDDLSEVPDDQTGYVLLVNDHGNCTLYEIEIPNKKHGFRVASDDLKEIWAIV